jgi:hypothetical protein
VAGECCPQIGTMEYSLSRTEQGALRACCGHMRFLQKEGALEDQRLCFPAKPKARERLVRLVAKFSFLSWVFKLFDFIKCFENVIVCICCFD